MFDASVHWDAEKRSKKLGGAYERRNVELEGRSVLIYAVYNDKQVPRLQPWMF